MGRRVVPVATKAKPASGWQFVNLSDPAHARHRTVQSVVRAHAMRHVKKEQRDRTTAARDKSLEQKPELSCPSVATQASTQDDAPKDSEQWPAQSAMMTPVLRLSIRSKTETRLIRGDGSVPPNAEGPRYLGGINGDRWTYFLESRHENLRTPLGPGRIDPFESYPIGGCSRNNDFVLYHFVSVMAVNCLPVLSPVKAVNPLTGVWLPYAMQDQTLFAATLTFAAVHLDIMMGRLRTPGTLWRKQETIKAINANMQSPDDGLSNANIGAVAMMASLESISGNYREVRIHVDALRKMVGMRCGLQNLGWEGVLQMFISWQDLLFSSIMAEAPHYEPTPCHPDGSVPFSPPTAPTTAHSMELCSGISTIFQDMRHLTLYLSNGTKTRSLPYCKAIHAMCGGIEKRLARLGYEQQSRSQWTEYDFFLEGHRLAALIYIKTINVLPNHLSAPLIVPTDPNLCAAKDALCSHLHECMLECPPAVLAPTQPGNGLWALWMYAMLALNDPEEDLFTQPIADGCQAAGIGSWEVMEGELKRICWRDELRTEACKRVWRKVEDIDKRSCSGWERLMRSRVCIHSCQNPDRVQKFVPFSDEDFTGFANSIPT